MEVLNVDALPRESSQNSVRPQQLNSSLLNVDEKHQNNANFEIIKKLLNR